VISMLDFLLTRLQTGFNHLILWADNCPGQFKETYLFFYCDYLINTNRFLRVDLKFLLEGHTYSICDRRFGNIEAATRRFEVIRVFRLTGTKADLALIVPLFDMSIFLPQCVLYRKMYSLSVRFIHSKCWGKAEKYSIHSLTMIII